MEIQAVLFRLLPVLSALAVASLIEVLIPLRQQSRRSNGRLATNLWLLAITLGLAMLLNLTLALGAAYVARSGMGLLQVLGIGEIASFGVALLALDGATYLAHRLLHRIPLLWRVHLVHHIDASVDATTGFRQHPIEGVWRFGFIALTAWTLGAPPAAVAVYRLLGALNSALEHANIRVPRVVDRALVWLWVTPDMPRPVIAGTFLRICCAFCAAVFSMTARSTETKFPPTGAMPRKLVPVTVTVSTESAATFVSCASAAVIVAAANRAAKDAPRLSFSEVFMISP